MVSCGCDGGDGDDGVVVGWCDGDRGCDNIDYDDNSGGGDGDKKTRVKVINECVCFLFHTLTYTGRFFLSVSFELELQSFTGIVV